MGHDQPDEEKHQRKQPIQRGRAGLANDPAKNNDPDKHDNAYVSQPKMPALKQSCRGFMPIEPAGIFSAGRIWRGGSFCPGRGFSHDGVFGHPSFWLVSATKAKVAQTMCCLQSRNRLRRLFLGLAFLSGEKMSMETSSVLESI
jgi:hypothetical protein